MHPQLLFRLRLLLCVLLGVSAALVLPNRNLNARDTPELINVGSSNEASPESTTIYFPDHVSPNVQTASTTPSTVESLGQVTPNNNKRRQAHGTQFQQSASEVKIARDETKEPGSIYKRDGGGSNMTIIYIIVSILAVGLLIAGCICLRKCQGH